MTCNGSVIQIDVLPKTVLVVNGFRGFVLIEIKAIHLAYGPNRATSGQGIFFQAVQKGIPGQSQ